MKKTIAAVLVLAAGFAAAPVLAQGEAGPAAPAPAAVQTPTFTDGELESIARLLTGSWRSKAPASMGQGNAGEVFVGIAPVRIEGMTDTLYMEVADVARLRQPYRQVILQLHRSGDSIRLRTMELRRPRGYLGSVVGLWAAPEAFAPLTRDDLVTTMDLVLTKDATMYRGASAHRFPTNLGGAVEMGSEISFNGEMLRVADRGFDGTGKQVWGPATGESFEFTKAEVVKVTRKDGGLVILDYPSTLQGEAAQAGQMVSVHYVGYLTNGTVFDSSYSRGEAFTYAQGQRLIQGWTTGMADARVGMQRRMVIPPALGYGDQGAGGVIPPGATLVFDIEVLGIKNAELPPELSPAAPRPAGN